MKKAYLEVFSNEDRTRHYVRVVFGNGRKALVSEGNGYTRRQDALRAARAMRDAMKPPYPDGARGLPIVDELNNIIIEDFTR